MKYLVGLLVVEENGIINNLSFDVIAGGVPRIIVGKGFIITVIGLLLELITPSIVDFAV